MRIAEDISNLNLSDGAGPSDAPPPTYVESSANASRFPVGDEKGSRINVLILGETQNGKSTLIKRLATYANQHDTQIEIGRGTGSCTTSVGHIPISTELKRYRMTDKKDRDATKRNYSDNLDLSFDDVSVKAVAPENGGKEYSFNIIDTPGLNDSLGRDMNIMVDIVGCVGGLEHLNAVIYVRKVTTPFDDSFNQFFKYLQRSMPSICNGLIVVHTNVTVDLIEERISAKKIDIRESRIAAFEQTMESKVSLQHFFIDSDPSEDVPFAIVESLNACFDILDMLRVQAPVPTSDVRLLKTPKMREIDKDILLNLERLKSRISSDYNVALRTKGAAEQDTLKTTREVERLAADIESSEKEVEKCSTDDPVHLGNQSCHKNYSLIGDLLLSGKVNLEPGEVKFDSEYEIMDVQTSATGGCKWGDINWRGTSWSGKVSPNALRSIHGSASFYTTMRKKHNVEIRLLERHLAELRQSRQFHEQRLDANGQGAQRMDRHVQELGHSVDACDAVIASVEKEMLDVTLWPVLRRFYEGKGALSSDERQDFVGVYDPKLAEKLWARAG